MASQPERKRFYQSADVADSAEGFAVRLDGRPIKTPAGAPFLVPTRALADAIAEEWNAQGESIQPAKMPLTRLANSAIDGVSGRMAEVRDDITKYAATDLVCYRAMYPEALVEKQAHLWDPILSWVEKRYGAAFKTGVGVTHVTQPLASLDALQEALGRFGAFRLAALHVIVTLTGSALIALTLADGGIGEATAWTAAQVDEDWQIAQWGEDFEAAQRRKNRLAEFQNAWRFFQLA